MEEECRLLRVWQLVCCILTRHKDLYRNDTDLYPNEASLVVEKEWRLSDADDAPTADAPAPYDDFSATATMAVSSSSSCRCCPSWRAARFFSARHAHAPRLLPRVTALVTAVWCVSDEGLRQPKPHAHSHTYVCACVCGGGALGLCLPHALLLFCCFAVLL